MKTRITARQRESKPSRSEALCDSQTAFCAKLCLRDIARCTRLNCQQHNGVMLSLRNGLLCAYTVVVLARWRDVTVHR